MAPARAHQRSMLFSSASGRANGRMITAIDGATVAGSFEVDFEPRRPRMPEPDPGETVRLPIAERAVRLWPAAQA